MLLAAMEHEGDKEKKWCPVSVTLLPVQVDSLRATSPHSHWLCDNLSSIIHVYKKLGSRFQTKKRWGIRYVRACVRVTKCTQPHMTLRYQCWWIDIWCRYCLLVGIIIPTMITVAVFISFLICWFRCNLRDKLLPSRLRSATDKSSSHKSEGTYLFDSHWHLLILQCIPYSRQWFYLLLLTVYLHCHSDPLV